MQEKSPRLRRIQWIALTFLTLAGIVNYLDRSTLSIANHSVSGELGLSASQMGLLLSAFSFAYAFSQLPVGAMLDRFGARVMLGLGMFVWSCAQLCGGLVHTLPRSASAKRRNFRRAPRLSANGMRYANAAVRRVFSPPRRPSDRRSRRPFSPCCCCRSAGAGCSS